MSQLFQKFSTLSITKALRLRANARLPMDAGSQILFSAASAVTAAVGGGQTNAVPLINMFNRITTVATAGDSTKLPPATLGSEIYVVSTAANGPDLFPFLGDQINALGANTAIRLAQNLALQFRCLVAGTWTATSIPQRDAKYTTRALSTSTAAAGELTGARFVNMNNSGANPGTYTTRTGAQMVADGSYNVGDSYMLRIVNGQGTGVLTLAAGDANVTITGTATMATNSFRDFEVTITGTNTLTIQNVATGTFS